MSELHVSPGAGAPDAPPSPGEGVAPPPLEGGVVLEPGARTVDGARARGRTRVDWRLAISIGLGVAGGLLLLEGAQAVISRLQGLLVMVLVSLFLSFAMEPAVQWMAQRDVRRGLGTAVVFLASFALFGGFVAAMVPLIVDQVTGLVDAGPTLVEGLGAQAERLPGELGRSLSDFLARQQAELPDRIPEIAGELGSRALGLGSAFAGGLVQFLTVLLVTFYLVADGPHLRRVLSSRLPPTRQREFLDIWELAVSKTGGYVYSRALTAIASATFHIIAFSVIGLEYATALGVWVGIVSSLIPVVGTYLAGALPLLVALAGDPVQALWVVATIVVYQQIENYLVAPRITASTMELHPAVAFLAVLAGAALLGAVGALLALPAAAIVQALFSAYGERYEVTHSLAGDIGGTVLRRQDVDGDTDDA